MAKRKRSPDDDLEKKLSEYQQELFRAIKAAKGLERQRLSKRLQRDKKYPEKIQRLQREVVVLKVRGTHRNPMGISSLLTLRLHGLPSLSTSDRPPKRILQLRWSRSVPSPITHPFLTT